jgi:glycosyltransferase involved in cell wall biosynthesis
LRIGLDARSVGLKICGVSRVTMCQIEALVKIDSINEYIVYTDALDTIPGLPANFSIVKTECNRMNVLQDFRFRRFLEQDNLDILHVMHSWLPMSIPPGIKKVVTIHDIFSVTDPLFFIKRKPLHYIFREYFRFITWLTVARADAIFTVSEYCVNEIRRVFNAKNKKIEVVYHSPGVKPDGQPNNTRLVRNEYLYYLGNFRNYKNVPTLILGYARFLKSTDSPIDLVLAGNDDNKGISALCVELGISDNVHYFHRPTDEVVDNLYRNARAFVFPSLFEGFGIPPIEAMSYGIPVIISDAEALVETSGDAALVFDKTSPEDLAAKILQLLSDSDLRNDLVQRGYECASRFTWENSARQIKAVYESV